MRKRDGEERWGRKMGKREMEERWKRGDRVLLFDLVPRIGMCF